MKWTKAEMSIINQYRRTMKSVKSLCFELDASGFMRTYKSVTRKIESMGWSRPTDVTDTGLLPKILIFDIETTPMPVWVWDFGKQYVPHTNLVKDKAGNQKFWYVLSWAAKWLYDDDTISDVLTPEEAVGSREPWGIILALLTIISLFLSFSFWLGVDIVVNGDY